MDFLTSDKSWKVLLTGKGNLDKVLRSESYASIGNDVWNCVFISFCHDYWFSCACVLSLHKLTHCLYEAFMALLVSFPV